MKFWSIDSESMIPLLRHSNTPLFNFLTELSQKSEIILEEQPDVIDSVLQHRDSLYPHAKSESRKFLRIVANKMEHLGIDHAGAEDF